MNFGIQLENNEISQRFLNETDARLQKSDFLMNPFRDSGIRQVGRDFYLVKMHSIYFNPGIVFVLLGIIAYMFNNLWMMGIMFGIAAMLYFMFSRYLLYSMLCLGLKKAGYKGKVKLLSDQDTIELLIGEMDIRLVDNYS